MATRAPTATTGETSCVAVRGRASKPAAPSPDRGADTPPEAPVGDARWRREIVLQVLTETLVHKRLQEVAARLEKKHAAN